MSAVALLTAGAALAGDCSQSAPHRLTAAPGDATEIVVIGRAGTLRVTGARTSTVTVTGEACASDRDFLSQMRIEARREGTALRIEAIIPDKVMIFGFHEARLDFEVTVPDSLPVRVTDGSGEAEVRGVASLEVTDGSGELEIRDVRGDVRVRDGSGSIEIDGVGGTVTIDADGSGSIDIRDVRRDVIVETDGSGGIEVADVRGNFTVHRDGSGGIDYDRVSGSVRIPVKD
jgi:hypothetical protein